MQHQANERDNLLNTAHTVSRYYLHRAEQDKLPPLLPINPASSNCTSFTIENTQENGEELELKEPEVDKYINLLGIWILK